MQTLWGGYRIKISLKVSRDNILHACSSWKELIWNTPTTAHSSKLWERTIHYYSLCKVLDSREDQRADTKNGLKTNNLEIVLKWFDVAFCHTIKSLLNSRFSKRWAWRTVKGVNQDTRAQVSNFLAVKWMERWHCGFSLIANRSQVWSRPQILSPGRLTDTYKVTWGIIFCFDYSSGQWQAWWSEVWVLLSDVPKSFKKTKRKERNEDATGVVEVHSESSLESGHTTPVNIHTLCAGTDPVCLVIGIRWVAAKAKRPGFLQDPR